MSERIEELVLELEDMAYAYWQALQGNDSHAVAEATGNLIQTAVKYGGVRDAWGRGR